jgi:hypothetical protein
MEPDVVLSVLRALEAAGVRYALVGGVAINFHGLPRATTDIDIFVSPDPDNISRMPVRKLRSLQDSEDACWRSRDDPDLWRVIAAVWSFSRRVAPQRFTPGVYKAHSLEEASLLQRQSNGSHTGTQPAGCG